MQWEGRDFWCWMLVLSFALTVGPLWGKETLVLAEAMSRPELLEQLEGQELRVRGFLYAQDSAWVLAAEPNLRTCCVGAPHKRESQLWIANGDVPENPPLRAITFVGSLRRVASGDEEAYWQLADASMEADVMAPWPWGAGACLGFLFVVWGFWRVRQRRALTAS